MSTCIISDTDQCLGDSDHRHTGIMLRSRGSAHSRQLSDPIPSSLRINISPSHNVKNITMSKNISHNIAEASDTMCIGLRAASLGVMEKYGMEIALKRERV